MNLELSVFREYFDPNWTEGKLYIDGKYHCYTLEDCVRPDGVKIKGRTAIPEGRYKVTISYSPHFKRQMMHINNVPMFDGILIHGGNTSADTLGCILIAKNKGENRIYDCKDVLDQLFDQVEKALLKGEEVWITVGKAKQEAIA